MDPLIINIMKLKRQVYDHAYYLKNRDKKQSIIYVKGKYKVNETKQQVKFLIRLLKCLGDYVLPEKEPTPHNTDVLINDIKTFKKDKSRNTNKKNTKKRKDIIQEINLLNDNVHFYLDF